MYLVMIQFIIKTYVVRIDKSSYNTFHENDLLNESFCELEIEVNDNDD